MKLLVLCLALVIPASAHRPPTFQDYPVTDIFRGEPVGPDHPGGLYNVKKETNFAGHYMVTAWAPGGDNLSIDIFDTKTGHVFLPPIFPKRFLGKNCANCIPTNPWIFRGADFNVDSSLMILGRACPTEGLQHLLQYTFFLGCGRYYFVWEGDHFRLLP